MYFDARTASCENAPCPGFGNDRIRVTRKMLLRDGRPWIPVMGEMHYSRVPADRWADTLIKMKEGGVDVVASYVFWIHHEEEKGVFRFDGSRDIRRFIRLCHEHGLEFCLRIGPWAHGECRNGGFPDWLCQECESTLRSAHEPYFAYVRRYIRAIADQVRDLDLFGIQVENEMTDRPEYMALIRQTVLDAGLTAPLLTATAWGNADLPDTLLPMYGGYPEAPWAGHTRELEPNANYFFSYMREDGNIGTDLLGKTLPDRAAAAQTSLYPFMTCELGGGNQITYHRRPLISSRDVEALAICKLGSGANLLGYYMYAGGLNPIGRTTTQESKATGYPNDCPVISYDFQSPIGDMGQIRESRMRLARIHQFLHSFGEMLAPMDPVMPDQMPASLDDTSTLRCALRSDGSGGFLFVNNHIRLHPLPDHPNQPFSVDFHDRRIAFTLDIPSGASFFMPVGLRLAGLDIHYASAQPVSIDENILTLIQIPGIEPRIALADGRVMPLAPGENPIGDTTVVLLPFDEYVPSALTDVSIESVPLASDASVLLDHLPLRGRPLEYRVRWSPEDRWLVIRAIGNVGCFLCGGEPVSDFYLCGGDWIIRLDSLPCCEGRLLIVPFHPDDIENVYLETPFLPGDHTPKAYVSRAPLLKTEF